MNSKIDKKTKILFLCTGNSCRSQMAEGWTRYFWNEKIEPYSAGVRVDGLNRYAVQVMKEAGVDISGQYSKHIDELKGIDFDIMITICESARQQCPYFPSKAKIIHHGFEDPADTTGTEEEILLVYRKIRDQIADFVKGLPDLNEKIKRS
jgi:arsenate reductase (thioredoxin)